MSLVAYDASSDEDSENEIDAEVPVPIKTIVKAPRQKLINGHISDEDDFQPEPVLDTKLQSKKPFPMLLSLPKPKYSTIVKNDDEELDGSVALAFSKLPLPKSGGTDPKVIVEEDDEFLHKKPLPSAEDKKPKSIVQAGKSVVKITIPALHEFEDVDKELTKKKTQTQPSRNIKGSGLLSLLPTAKSERNFSRAAATINVENISTATVATKPPMFVPDTVKNRRPAFNTEGVDGIKATTSKKASVVTNPSVTPLSHVQRRNNESSDEDEASAGDFFSLNAENKLPEVNLNEINAMVAKKAAKMAEKNREASLAIEQKGPVLVEDYAEQQARKRYHDQQLDNEAVNALCGVGAKRRRKQKEKIQVTELSGAQVLPDHEEWMRTALATSTAFQPTGVLTDEEPVTGTRRKHQITYLAHKAKANEAELQAMWAVNRQNRRATQSKYGF